MKKYIAIFLVVVSCLFAFSGCSKKDKYYVDPDTLNFYGEYHEDFALYLEWTNKNNFSICLCVDVFLYDKNGNHLETKNLMSSFTGVHNLIIFYIYENQLPTNFYSYECKNLTVMKCPFDKKYTDTLQY